MATTVPKKTGSQEGPRAIWEKIGKEQSVLMLQADTQKVGRNFKVWSQEKLKSDLEVAMMAKWVSSHCHQGVLLSNT